jgi:hypothetical protein
MKEGKLRNIRDRAIKIFIGVFILLCSIIFSPIIIIVALWNWFFGNDSLKEIYTDAWFELVDIYEYILKK